MASRVSRKTVASSSFQVSQDQTTSTDNSRPLSPTRQSRLKEKADLQNLNDRLADYIDRVRHLETENSRLTRQIQTSESTVTREVTNIKSMYEKELSDIRKLLDDTARERAKSNIEANRLFEENEELKSKLTKTTRDLELANEQIRAKTAKLAQVQNGFDRAISERAKLNDQLTEAQHDLAKLRQQMAELRKSLEDETLKRVDLENLNQSLREDLSFKEQVFSKELNETRTKRQIEISEIDGRLSENYNAKLQEALQDLRNEYEAQMSNNRAEIELLYEAKIKNLQGAANRNSSSLSTTLQDVRKSRARNEELMVRLGHLETQNTTLQARIRELEQALEEDRMRHVDDLTTLETELNRLRDEMSNQMREYQDLLDIKISLDLEISAYRKLLEGEEARLNISPNQSPNHDQAVTSRLRDSSMETRMTRSSRTPTKTASKRKRTIIEETLISTTTKSSKS